MWDQCGQCVGSRRSRTTGTLEHTATVLWAHCHCAVGTLPLWTTLRETRPQQPHLCAPHIVHFSALYQLWALHNLVQCLVQKVWKVGAGVQAGEAAEFNLWHRISSRARAALPTFIPHICPLHTLHSYWPPSRTYITLRLVACYILTLWSHVYHLTSRDCAPISHMR